MFKNYLKIAFRNIRKHKGYSFINVLGLTAALCSVFFILLYVLNEISYDGFHEKKDRIYRVVQHWSNTDYMGSTYFAVTPGPLAEAMENELPEVIQTTRIKQGRSERNALIAWGNKRFYESGLFADNNFFTIFTFEMLKGEGEPTLQSPFSIILTERLAVKLFGAADPVGKTIRYNDRHDLTVRGVMKHVPANSHMQFDYIVSFCTLASTTRGARSLERWRSQSYLTYFELQEDVPIRAFEK
jgi:putative ABC transport system permease protein